MNKSELAAAIAAKTGLTKGDTEKMLEAFVEIVTGTLKNGDAVGIAGFGEFLSRQRAGRTGVNPRRPTEKIQIAPMRVAKFKVGSNLKKALKISSSPLYL